MIDPASDEARIARRQSFDAVACLYDEMRPGYPPAVFDEIIATSGIGSRSRLLEIGCGTGHATLVFARHGFRVDCVELGENMAAVARANLADLDRVAVICADFDHWRSAERYDLIYSASAYHWLNPATRIEHIAHHLAPGGWVAVWRNHFIRGSGPSDEFFHAAQAVYAREAPALAAKFSGMLDPTQVASIEREEWLASGLFRDPETRVYTWSKQYTVDEYIRMLDTHSDHRLLPEANRTRLFTDLARLADDFGGAVIRDHATILHIAQKAS